MTSEKVRGRAGGQTNAGLFTQETETRVRCETQSNQTDRESSRTTYFLYVTWVSPMPRPFRARSDRAQHTAFLEALVDTKKKSSVVRFFNRC